MEDDADFALGLSTFLRGEGAAVHDVRTVSDALHAFREQSPHVVLTDLTLSDSDGLTLLAAVRKIGRGQGQPGSVPVIVLTGAAPTEDRARVAAAGFTLHLTKPVEPSEIVTAVLMCAHGRAEEFAGTRGKSDGSESH